MDSTKSATIALMFTFAACAVGPQDPPRAPSRSRDALLTNTFVMEQRITIPYVANFGSLSGLAYDPSDDSWWTHDDNRTGTVTYPTIFNFKVINNQVVVQSQMPLRDEAGNNVVASVASTLQSVVTAGLDPEGIALAPDGSFWMIEEENETFMHVSRQGQILSRHYAPGFRASFSPDAAAGPVTRVRGAGFEGIAVSDDGNTVYGIHQTALLAALIPPGEADVTFVAALDVPSNTWRIYKVSLDPLSTYVFLPGPPAPRIGAHGLDFEGYDALGREQLIWIERDNQRDARARDKRIYRVSLPEYSTYANTVVPKTLVVDLVALGYQLEKPEGVVHQGNRFYVISDNVQTATDPMEFTIIQQLEAPDLTCVGSAGSALQLQTDPGQCSVSVGSANGKAGTCTGGGDGLATCTFNGSDPATLALGAHTVAVVGTAVDTASASCTSHIEVVDGQAPSVSVAASPASLWPPNHKFRDIALSISSGDNCGAAPTSCVVTSNEPGVEGDYRWVGGQLQLRAERNGGGNGRVYTITCTATDGSGNASSASATVVVPHNQ